jgi:hypothetical protein
VRLLLRDALLLNADRILNLFSDQVNLTFVKVELFNHFSGNTLWGI